MPFRFFWATLYREANERGPSVYLEMHPVSALSAIHHNSPLHLVVLVPVKLKGSQGVTA